MEATAAHGYEQYEISNFARPGFRCEHNQIYWRNEPYLGFGAGAVAYWNGIRRTNCLLPGEYIRRMRDGRSLAVEEEIVEPQVSLGESLMLGLRMIDGVNLSHLRQRYGLDVRAQYAAHVHRMMERGLLSIEEDWMKLTPQGIPLANDVWAGFVA
jgi:oxygen-independent coproporphyrinogen-3 oxidase